MNQRETCRGNGTARLGKAEEAAVEFGRMAGETDDPEWKSNLLLAEHVCYCMLGRLVDAVKVLQTMRQIKTDNVAIEMNKGFLEACFFAQKDELNLSLKAFDSMLNLFSKPLARQRKPEANLDEEHPAGDDQPH